MKTFRPPEDFVPFYSWKRRKIKKGRFVKDVLKYTEIKIIGEVDIAEVKKMLESKVKEIDFTKIQIATQDDWIKKIKVI